MPARTTLTSDEKSKVKATLTNNGTAKIATAASVRIYYAYPSPATWSYTGLEGALALVRDTIKGGHWFRLVDLLGTRGVLWEHELYEGFEFNKDAPFLYSFDGDRCMIGFVFADSGEASTMRKKVEGRGKSDAPKASSSSTGTTKKKSKSGKTGGKIDKSMISGPVANTFEHRAHMGIDIDGTGSDGSGFVSRGVDPSWVAIIGQLQDLGINPSVLKKEEAFIQDFL
ncbi:hypothetical protein BKA62DRAFT_596751, partial [Auriculariales sp. MPI-PUGE-AT-0066]